MVARKEEKVPLEVCIEGVLIDQFPRHIQGTFVPNNSSSQGSIDLYEWTPNFPDHYKELKSLLSKSGLNNLYLWVILN